MHFILFHCVDSILCILLYIFHRAHFLLLYCTDSIVQILSRAFYYAYFILIHYMDSSWDCIAGLHCADCIIQIALCGLHMRIASYRLHYADCIMQIVLYKLHYADCMSCRLHCRNCIMGRIASWRLHCGDVFFLAILIEYCADWTYNLLKYKAIYWLIDFIHILHILLYKKV